MHSLLARWLDEKHPENAAFMGIVTKMIILNGKCILILPIIVPYNIITIIMIKRK